MFNLLTIKQGNHFMNATEIYCLKTALGVFDWSKMSNLASLSKECKQVTLIRKCSNKFF